MFDLNKVSVFVAGHHGMVGSALVRRLRSESCSILTADRHNLDLTRQQDTERKTQSASSAHTNLTLSSSPQRKWAASPRTAHSQWIF
jgi:nucleoside-diphosphate-sugar epimerase